ncbi:acyl-CoA synthetases/AMP-acid ligases II [Microsporum canis CBS 113480]|uniref:Acyl-CoA synthetases/AMP-acid ligases II n=1 Tax=Arthroderma otae (strain ATCC MYA-4605 / CBS 113480) TaxID=554155 RepID=C5FLL0_ARTOC|nr:acyl-CoA synthetases/AMP-acid ligases II [Microsporum canis CBS 113480]EEQ30582.1 acyl-CoA synthetases/AMP-acid ligases II [Microsporum canis CBS 113480]
MEGATNPGELPNEPIFVQLLKVSRQVDHVIVHDANRGITADFTQLLADILQTRCSLRASLPDSVLGSNRLLKDTNPYVLLLPDGHYDFIIGAYSILSIGGAFVPLEEAMHILRKCRSCSILASQAHLPLARELQRIAASEGLEVTIIQIQSQTSATDMLLSSLTIGTGLVIPTNSPGMVLFTSGTSGPPKGVVLKRDIFFELYTLCEPNDIVLSHKNYIWIGSALALILHPLAGSRLEVIFSDPQAIWERLRKGGVTRLAANPYLWNNMMQYYQQQLQGLPPTELEEYVRGARSLRVAQVGGAMPHSSLLKFWRDMGRPLGVSYGTTELGGLGIKHHAGNADAPERCIGKPSPKMTVRLSDGDHGEIQIKSPTLFLGYLDNEAATRAVFTDDGFYRTGDLAHLEGGNYVLDGRATQDSAIVRFAPPNTCGDGTIEQSLRFLRTSLATKLPAFMLPTVLRILQEGEELPRTVSNKVIKAKVIEQYFPLADSWKFPAEVELWRHDVSDNGRPRKPWDWGGVAPPKPHVPIA